VFRRPAALRASGITDVSPQSGARVVWRGSFGGVDGAVQLQSRGGERKGGREGKKLVRELQF